MTDGSRFGAVDELLSGVRFGKFVSVGAIGAVFDLTVSTVLSVGLGVPPTHAKLAGAEVAIVVMFVINERWTFAEYGEVGRLNTLRRLLKSNLVRSGGILAQLLVVGYLSGLPIALPLGGFDLWRVLPFPIAIGVSVVLNYVFESLFTWRVTSA